MEFHKVFSIRRDKYLFSLEEITLPVTLMVTTGVWSFRGFWVDCDKWDDFDAKRAGEFVVSDDDVVTISSVGAAKELFSIASLDWGVVRYSLKADAEPVFVASCIDGAYWVVATADDGISEALRNSFPTEISVASAAEVASLGREVIYASRSTDPQ